MKYINLTPHAIVLNDGRVFEPQGEPLRVSSSYSVIVDDECEVIFGELSYSPERIDGVKYIVSALVAQAAHRDDFVCPATGHPQCIRENGFIKSVPCFVRASY